MSPPATAGNDVRARLVEAAHVIAIELQTGRFHRALALLRPLLRPEVVRDLATHDLASLIERNSTATKSPSLGELRVVSSGIAELRVRIVQPHDVPKLRVKTLSRHTLIGNAGRGAFTIRRWFQPAPMPNDLFDAKKRIERGRDLVVEPGEAIDLRAGRDAFEIVAGKRAAVAVIAGGAHAVSLSWIHRCDSGLPLSVEPATRDWLLLRELLAFAEALCDPSLVPAIALLASHPSHFVRWSAAKASINLAPETAVSTLRTLARDQHVQVRAAAQHLLAKATS